MLFRREWGLLLSNVVLLSACSMEVVRETPSFELVDPAQRLDASLVNAHAYGSFVLTFDGGATAILSGPANFPGNPPGGPGTCDNGLWINSKGKRTAGSVSQPHPHCTATGKAMEVVLEPISSSATTASREEACPVGGCNSFLIFDDLKAGGLSVQYKAGIKGAPGSTVGTGTIDAYAIDAATLNGANVRVGTITIDLTQYNSVDNLFGTCDMGDDQVLCLPLVVTATYKPLGAGGVGTIQTVNGFLWWAPATRPYNY
jgi:hypothetical protein